MPTFTIRKRFTDDEIGEIRKAYRKLAKANPDIGLEMRVDGSPIRVDYGPETFFRFSSRKYAIEINPMNVRHGSNSPATGMVIYQYGSGDVVANYKVASSVQTPSEVLGHAVSIVGHLEALSGGQRDS